MRATSGKRGRRKGARNDSRSAPRLPKDVLLHWSARLRFFSRVLEGGPGKPATLALWAGLLLAAGWQGIRWTEQRGIGGAGPALIFLSAAGCLFLLVWLLVKGVLRGRAVVFYLSGKGVGILPSPRQETVDQWMGILAWLSFLATFRGGTWSAWRPFTPWKDVRRVEVRDPERELLIKGGAWHIRLTCGGELYGAVKRQVLERARAAARGCVVSGE